MSFDKKQPIPKRSNFDRNHLGKIMVGTAATLGMSLAAMDTALNVALPSMTEDLNADSLDLVELIMALVLVMVWMPSKLPFVL